MVVKKCQYGFSLIEIAVVIAIIGIMSAVAVPTYSSWLPKMRVNAAARNLASDIQWARMIAVKENNPYLMVFNTAASSYIIYDDNNENNVPDAGEEARTVNIGQQYPDIVFGFIQANDPAGNPIASSVTFCNNCFGTALATLQFSTRGIFSEQGYVYLIPNTDIAAVNGERLRSVRTTRAGQSKIFAYNPFTNNWN